MPDGPRINNLNVPMVGKWKWKGTHPQIFQSDMVLVKWKDIWLEISDGPQFGYVLRVLVILKDFWLETGMVMCSGNHMEV